MNQTCFYWSPTGGTRKVALLAAQGWGGKFSQVDLMELREPMHFGSGDVCLFAVPSYGGRVPAACLEKLENLSGNGAMAVLIAVFGNRAIDDTLLELSDSLRRIGFRPVGAMEAVAQHSLIPRYGAGRPDQQDQQEIRDFAGRIRRAVEEKGVPGELSLPGSRPYREFGGVPLKPSVGSGCVACGICVDQCPVGAIPITNCRTTDPRKCISCMHCVAVCPKHARKLNKLMVFAAGQTMKKVCAERKPNRLYL